MIKRTTDTIQMHLVTKLGTVSFLCEGWTAENIDNISSYMAMLVSPNDKPETILKLCKAAARDSEGCDTPTRVMFWNLGGIEGVPFMSFAWKFSQFKSRINWGVPSPWKD
jgi:hypothetical protein